MMCPQGHIVDKWEYFAYGCRECNKHRCGVCGEWLSEKEMEEGECEYCKSVRKEEERIKEERRET